MSASEGRFPGHLLARPATRLLVAALAAGVLAGGAALLLPPTYESQANIVFSVSTQQVSLFTVTTPQTSSPLVSAQLLSNLPSPAALAQAFTQRLETRAFSELLDEPDPQDEYSARYEEKKGLLVLKASGKSREEARKRGDRLVAVAQAFLQERLSAAARATVTSSVELARIDLRTGEKILGEVRDLLRSAPKRGGTSSPAVAANLEAMKVDPVIARSSNPAEAFLSLQEAQLSSQVASSRARMEALDGVLKDPEALSRLVGQALQVQVLSPPAEPVRKSSPRGSIWGGVAALAVLGAGVLYGSVRDALR